MKLLLEAKDYCSDLRWVFYLLSGLLALFVGSVFLLFFLFSDESFIITCIAPLFSVLMFVSLVHSLGGFSSNSLKVYDGGMEIRGGKLFLRFNEIRTVKFYLRWGYKFVNRGTVISTLSGRTYHSGENFTDKKRLDLFIQKIQPVLEENGFRLGKKEEDKRYLSYEFIR